MCLHSFIQCDSGEQNVCSGDGFDRYVLLKRGDLLQLDFTINNLHQTLVGENKQADQSKSRVFAQKQSL